MMSKWISVEDELPEIRQLVQVADNLKQVTEGYFSVDYLGAKYWHTAKQKYYFDIGIKRITHWQPKPEPPEVDDEPPHRVSVHNWTTPKSAGILAGSLQLEGEVNDAWLTGNEEYNPYPHLEKDNKTDST
jgi:hypothetical protein